MTARTPPGKPRTAGVCHTAAAAPIGALRRRRSRWGRSARTRSLCWDHASLRGLHRENTPRNRPHLEHDRPTLHGLANQRPLVHAITDPAAWREVTEGFSVQLAHAPPIGSSPRCANFCRARSPPAKSKNLACTPTLCGRPPARKNFCDKIIFASPSSSSCWCRIAQRFNAYRWPITQIINQPTRVYTEGPRELVSIRDRWRGFPVDVSAYAGCWDPASPGEGRDSYVLRQVPKFLNEKHNAVASLRALYDVLLNKITEKSTGLSNFLRLTVAW